MPEAESIFSFMYLVPFVVRSFPLTAGEPEIGNTSVHTGEIPTRGFTVPGVQ